MNPEADIVDVNRTRQPGYGLLGARLNAHLTRVDADIAVWGDNLTDTRYWSAQSAVESIGYQVGQIGRPRSYGFTVTKRF